MNFEDHTGELPVCIGDSMAYVNGIEVSYNCWGWVINKITNKFIGINSPGFDNQIAQTGRMDMLAKCTKDGLEALGAEVEPLGALEDNRLEDVVATLLSDRYLVAMRLGKYGAYHYMRYDGGAWTHKWGYSGNLWQLNGITPNDEDAWTAYQLSPETGEVQLVPNTENIPFRPYSGFSTWYVKVTLPHENQSCCTIS